MILLNLFTAVVLENFEIQEEQAEWTLTPGALEVAFLIADLQPLYANGSLNKSAESL